MLEALVQMAMVVIVIIIYLKETLPYFKIHLTLIVVLVST